jgi:lipoprotein NlpD
VRCQRSICALGLCCLLLGGCANTGGEQRGSELSGAEQRGGERPRVYVVRPHDTVYSIAWRYGLDFRDLARWNHIGPDFRIAVGQTLILAPSTALGKPQPSLGAPAPPERVPPARAPPAQVPPAPVISGFPWAWPTDRTSAPQPVSGGGILLSGRLGQDIRASASGRVVYSGSGIRAYGNLIIIKHGENWLSAYAHSRDSLVHEGQDVLLGQVIGHMGEGAPEKPVLYFEIRRNGRPVDPLGFLPR